MATISIPFPSSAAAAVLALCGYGLALISFVHVLKQLLRPITNKSAPPQVFSLFPFIGNSVGYGIDPYKFLFDCREKYGPVFTFVLAGRKVTAALGTQGSNLVFNGKLSQVNAEMAYTHLTKPAPVFGTDVVYDCPNHMLMEQKKFVKYGLSTENFQRYVPLIVEEVTSYLANKVFGKGSNMKDAHHMASEITICTAAATLQGKEVRESLDESFAHLYSDLDGGFTPLNFVFPNLPLPSYKKRDEAHIKMRKFYLNIMEKRRQEGREDTDDMISALQGQTYKDGRTISDKEVAHMMIALLMAGQHTSAATSSWIILHLGADVAIQQALYEEQVKLFGRPDGTFEPLDYERLAEMSLLNACIKEV
ncbi:cytochrome P450, partial [Atractiella rhizophila]